MEQNPKERLRSVFTLERINLFLAVLGVVGTAWVVWLWGSILDLATTKPAPFAASCLFFFFLGFFVAYLVGAKEARAERTKENIRRENEEKKKKLQEKELLEAFDKRARETTFYLGYVSKMLLRDIADSECGFVRFNLTADKAREAFWDARLMILISETGENSCHIYLNDLGKRAIVVAGDIIRSIEKC